MKTETTPTESKVEAQINQLEGEIENNLTKFKENSTREILMEINKARGEIDDLKIKLSTERNLRETYWRVYKNTLTEEDFLDLWERRLRDEALLSKIREIETARLMANGKIWGGL